jgi:hypothetical protein
MWPKEWSDDNSRRTPLPSRFTSNMAAWALALLIRLAADAASPYMAFVGRLYLGFSSSSGMHRAGHRALRCRAALCGNTGAGLAPAPPISLGLEQGRIKWKQPFPFEA